MTAAQTRNAPAGPYEPSCQDLVQSYLTGACELDITAARVESYLLPFLNHGHGELPLKLVPMTLRRGI